MPAWFSGGLSRDLRKDAKKTEEEKTGKKKKEKKKKKKRRRKEKKKKKPRINMQIQEKPRKNLEKT